MCKCTPDVKTPFCGKPGCEWPSQSMQRRVETQAGQPSSNLDLAAALAHRACCGVEHDPLQGKLHGYCVVCGVPWPCETAKSFLRSAVPPTQRYVNGNRAFAACEAAFERACQTNKAAAEALRPAMLAILEAGWRVAEPPRAAWLPIETAPKNGTSFVGWCVRRISGSKDRRIDPVVARWQEPDGWVWTPVLRGGGEDRGTLTAWTPKPHQEFNCLHESEYFDTDNDVVACADCGVALEDLTPPSLRPDETGESP